MMTKKQAAAYLGVSYNTYLIREKTGVPVGKRIRSKPGGNYKIERDIAVKIWKDIKRKKYYNTRQQIADKYDVPLSVVTGISTGKTWNEVTGLPKKVYGEDFS